MLKNFIESKFYQKWIWRTYKPRSFKSVNNLIKSLNENAFYQQIYYKLRRFIMPIIEFPNNSYRAIKRGIQRGYRGWADEDIWGFDYYLSNIILGGLKRLKETKQGYPCDLTKKEWSKILNKMIYTFKLNKSFFDGNKFFDKLSKKEQKRYNEGFKLFQIHFNSLWD